MATGRAAGRRNYTRAGGFDAGPDSPEGRNIGESARQDPAGSPIPGLTGNIVNYETVRQEVLKEPVTRGQFEGMMAHGVPNDSESTEVIASRERGEKIRGKAPKSAEIPVRPDPVPVYLVEDVAGPKVYRTASPRHITVPANAGADPVRICGRSPNRVRIGLLNEDTATNIRFAQRFSDLNNGGGALLPWPNSSYTWLETQDELYAVTVSSTLSVTMSVIEEFEQER